ncbi:hypothetical protein, conserved [Babesia bigemina]|uniref:C3H1-type domain-containing protein n=1 Tax=Babesia bigemina TaxID=5866 RepID=A0A061BK11_BABBI|nr:hypothetical protein, conserved [Babesia bigemina]CDR71825.1 hypothetical protein, conserved [Babesia bigemina]|eukprot:XP_012770768.1 hypothetical protein, conserved [Babesia bigemina]
MGFLSGVLGAVKNENEVTTYDKYISDEDKRLNKVIEKLNNKIGSGRTGLAASVDAVQGWLEKYWTQVWNSTGTVNKKLSMLIYDKIGDECMKSVSVNDTNPLNEQLANWSRVVEKINNEVKGISSDVRELDSSLKQKISNEMKLIISGVVSLETSLKDRPFVKQVNEVDRQLKEQKQYVEKTINEGSEKVQESLKLEKTKITQYIDMKGVELQRNFHSQFWKICDKLGGLRDERKTNFSALKSNINDAQKLIESYIAHFDDRYRHAISRKFENIKSQVQYVDSDNTIFAYEKRSLIQQEVTELKSAIDAIGSELQRHVLSLGDKIRQAESLRATAFDNISEVYNKLDTYNHEKNKREKTRLGQEIDKISSSNTLIKNGPDSAQKEVEKLVTAVTEQVGQLDVQIQKDLDELKRGMNIDILAYVSGLVRNMMEAAKEASPGSVGSGGNGIKKLLEKIGTDSTFQKLKAWIQTLGDEEKKNLESGLYALNAYSKTSTNVYYDTQNITKALYEDIKESVGSAFMGADSDSKLVRTLMGQYREHIENVGNNTLKTKLDAVKGDALTAIRSIIRPETGTIAFSISQIQSQLEELRTKLHNDVIRKLDELRNKLGKDAQDTGELSLGQLKNEISNIQMNQITNETSKVQTLMQAILGKISMLEKAPKFVDERKKEVEALMDELRSEFVQLQNDMNYISAVVNAADVTLSNGIDSVGEALKAAEQNAYDVISTLQSELSDTVRQAFNDLQLSVSYFKSQLLSDVDASFAKVSYEVKQLFAKQKKADLRSLQALVSRQLKTIKIIIEKDLSSGVKGFLKTMGDVSVETTTLTVSPKKLNALKDKDTVAALSTGFQSLFMMLKDYIKKDITRVHNEHKNATDPEGSEVLYTEKLLNVTLSLSALLLNIKNKNRYDHRVPGMLDVLSDTIAGLTPQGFAKHTTPVLDCVTKGVTNFVGELQNAYISVYDGQAFTSELCQVIGHESNPREPRTIYDQTDYGQKCAKVFLTLLATLFNDCEKLRKICQETPFNHIYRSYPRYDNKLGDFFSYHGFSVSMFRDSHEGELRNKANFTGTDIHAMIHEKIFDVSAINLLKQWMTKKNKASDVASTDADNMSLLDILQFLYECLETYYRVCHVTSSSTGKHPSSVYDMLLWLTGLTHNRVYTDLALNGFEDLFEKPKDDDAVEANTEDGIAVGVEKEVSLAAYPHDITVPRLSASLRDVCVYSEEMLVAIMGHGHSEGRYACDFNTNPDKFAYPSDPSKCLDMLFEILLRLQEQLYLLYMRCRRTRDTMSWRECWYGRGVGGSSWKCNTMQCPEQISNQSADQKHKQTCNQNCNQTAECGIKSPLQSFLEDGLPGFLPHPYSKADCKMTCSLANHRGIPCKTPMGFSDISVMASHTSKGERIVEALRDVCGSKHSPLSQLCSLLLCLLNRPPQTLGDMFAFYYNFISNWGGKGREHKSDAFNGAVNDAYFGAEYQDFTIKNVFGSHIHDKNNHPKGDLFGLVDCYSGKGDRTPKGSCGPYMRPISGDIRNTFSSKHAGTYLSWIVYITETFYDLLKKLFEECNKCCGDDKPKCRTARCSRNCNFNGKKPDPNHADSCESIVKCKFTRPTLYKYGFVNEDALMLADKPTKRTCKDFCKALKTVLSDKVDDDAALAKLVYVTIPEFLYQIRFPFMTLTLSLWLLSLLYLIHIMVIRLDLLHIKSHLHSPSSHRIAAQSLLAAARVNKLNRVFYLQP